MLNKAILQGRLVADPELRTTQSGISACSFRLAVNRNYLSGNQQQPQADFINIVAWRQTAEFLSRYFTKGSMILVDGRIQTRDYTDNNGQRRYVTEVVADNVHFAASKRESGGGYASNSYGQGGGYNQSGVSGSSGNEFAELNEDDGELPF